LWPEILGYVQHSAFVQKYHDESLCSAKKIVPQPAERTQYIVPVRSRLNSKQQAPELGKCLCNLSSDIVLLAALPRKWKNVERALSNPSQHNESSFQNYCNWDAALLTHASSYNKLNKTKATPLFERKKWVGNKSHYVFCESSINLAVSAAGLGQCAETTGKSRSM